MLPTLCRTLIKEILPTLKRSEESRLSETKYPPSNHSLFCLSTSAWTFQLEILWKLSGSSSSIVLLPMFTKKSLNSCQISYEPAKPMLFDNLRGGRGNYLSNLSSKFSRSMRNKNIFLPDVQFWLQHLTGPEKLKWKTNSL